MIKLKSLILESKQSIINLGYTEIIATLFYEKFGNLAYIVANWYRQYSTNKDDKDWFQLSHYRSSHSMGLFDMTKMYYSTDTPSHYSKERENMGLSNDDYIESEMSDEYLKEQRLLWKKEISETLFNSTFFVSNTIISDIISGKLKDLSPYKDLGFWQASMKYDERRVFTEMTPLKIYPDGYKWINVGKRCGLLGHYMANCGSAGLMSDDPDRTLIGLFDINNKPHVIITYSPNQKRLSGEEGPGYSEVKSKYHQYVIDLTNLLGAKFDVGRAKSVELRLKYLLRGKGSNVKKLERYSDPAISSYYRFNIGKDVYYSNGYEAISLGDMMKIKEALKQKKIELQYHKNNAIKAAFNQYNKSSIESLGVKYINVFNIDKL